MISSKDLEVLLSKALKHLKVQQYNNLAYFKNERGLNVRNETVRLRKGHNQPLFSRQRLSKHTQIQLITTGITLQQAKLYDMMFGIPIMQTAMYLYCDIMKPSHTTTIQQIIMAFMIPYQLNKPYTLFLICASHVYCILIIVKQIYLMLLYSRAVIAQLVRA